jgi:hypothetical protein
MFRQDRATLAECMPWPTERQALLVKAGVGSDSESVAAFRAWRGLVGADDTIDAGSFRLLPLVFHRLQQQGCDDPVMPRLKALSRSAWLQNQTVFHLTAPAVAALEAAGIETMLIKGAPLALAVYPTVGSRPLKDLDIVVRKDAASRALRILDDLGWRAGSRVPLREMPDTHAIDLHAASGHELDLRWHCLRDTPAVIADDWFWDAAVPLDFCGVATRQPSPTGHLLHTLVHGVRSNLEPPVRWIADAMMLMHTRGQALDWDSFTGFARRQKLSFRVHLGLSYLVREHAAPVPCWVLDRLKADGISTIERMENIIYLRRPEEMYRPLLFPLADYWRFLRNEPIGRFLLGYCGYLQRRWELRNPARIPLAALAAIGRHVARSEQAP